MINADKCDIIEKSQDWISGDITSRKQTKRGFVALALVAIVAALAVGLGLGLQIKKRHSKGHSFSSPATPMCVSLSMKSSIVVTMLASLSSTIHLLRVSFRPITIDIYSSRVLKVLYVE